MEDNSIQKTSAGLLLFYGLMLVFGVSFLALLPTQTSPGPGGQGWWTQPALMPALSLGLITLMALILCIQHGVIVLRNPLARPNARAFGIELWQWILPLEFFVYFRLYMWLFEWVGYFLASTIFVLGLSLRVGLRSWRWALASVITGLALVALFKWGLNVFMPRPEVFQQFPNAFPNGFKNFWQEWL